MTHKEFDRLIDQYLQGDLPTDQMEQFEEHYFTCDSCFLKLEIQYKLQQKEVRIVPSNKKPALLLKPILALTSICLVIFSTFAIINHIKQSKLMIAISQFDAPVYVQTQTRNSDSKQLHHAMALYNKKEYSQSLKILENIPVDEPNPQVTFFKGINNLLLNKHKKSIRCFDTIIKEMNPSYYDDAIYYKGMALLKLKKKKRAIRQFKNLAEMFSPRATEAKAILKKLNAL